MDLMVVNSCEDIEASVGQLDLDSIVRLHGNHDSFIHFSWIKDIESENFRNILQKKTKRVIKPE
jgi:hypothetical protein